MTETVITKDLRFIRFVYLFGAFADLIVVVLYLVPGVMLGPLGIRETPDFVTRYVLIQATSLMLGWTLLLVWGWIRPVERRGVLLLTVPVCLGMNASAWFLLVSGRIDPAAFFIPLVLVVLPLVLSMLFLIAWFRARKAASVS